MSNYSVTTNFGAKDALASGDPNKLVLGSQLTTEFTNIATAIATKLDAGSGFANPTGTIGLTAVNGVLTTAMRSDAAPALSQSISPTWTGTHAWSGNTLTHSFAGKLTIGAPNAGVALQVSGLSATAAIDAIGSSTFVQCRDSGAAGAAARLGATNTANYIDFTWSVSAVPGVIRHGGTDVLTISTNRGLTMAAPASGTALVVSAVAGAVGIGVNGATGAAAVEASGSSTFMQVKDTGGNAAVSRLGASNTANYIDFTWGTSAVPGVIRHGGTDVVTINTNRGVSVAAPASGVALAVTGVSNANVISATASGTGAAVVANNFVQDEYRVAKTADETRTSTTTPADDAHLTLALPVGNYAIELYFRVFALTTAGMGMKWDLLFTGTSSNDSYAYVGVINTVFTGSQITNLGALQLHGNISTSGSDWVCVKGSLAVTATGTLKLQWCQNTSTATALTMRALSYMVAKRIS